MLPAAPGVAHNGRVGPTSLSFKLQDRPCRVLNLRQLLVTFPWCRSYKEWRLVQDVSTQGCAPDLIQSDEAFTAFLAHMLVEPHDNALRRCLLAPWSPTQPGQVLQLIDALQGVYRWYERSKILALRNDRLQFELDTMPFQDRAQLQLLEQPRSGEARVCIGVPVEGLNVATAASALRVPLSRDSGPGQLSCFVVHADFPAKADARDRAPEIYIETPDWALPLHMPMADHPKWTPDACLMEYVPRVTEWLQKRLDAHAGTLQQKHQLFVSLAEAFGPAAETRAEDGAITHRFNMQWDLRPLAVYVKVGPKFPEQPPNLSLQIIRPDGAPDAGLVHLKECPWSPRWSAGEMSVRVFNYIKSQAAALMRVSESTNPLVEHQHQQGVRPR